jgi:hypothetical protein
MASDNLNMEELTEERRRAIEASIRVISVDELKQLGAELFPYLDHPFRGKYDTFIEENAGATFHHAATHDHVHIIYCSTKDKGMWFLPGSGMGPLQAKGLKILKEIVKGKH